MSAFTLMSQDFFDKAWLGKAHEFNGFDGSGENRSPSLQWSGAPANTKSYALTMYDPDAHTGSGFWHWVAYDIRREVSALPQCSGILDMGELKSSLLKNASNDFGTSGYGGPCPPYGDKAHRYIFTLHALAVDELGATTEMPNAVVRYLIQANSIASAQLTGHYKR